MKNLIIYKTKSLGAAYVVAQEMLSRGFKLLEIFPVGGGGHVMLEHDLEIAEIEQEYSVTSEILTGQIINQCPIEVYKSYLSLENADAEKNLLIVDSDSLGRCFAIAKDLLQLRFKIVDLRLMRGTAAHSYLLVTSLDLQGLKLAWSKLRSEGVSCQIIEDLHPDFEKIL